MSSFRRPARVCQWLWCWPLLLPRAVGSDAFFADDFRHIDNANTPAADAGECAADNLFHADRHQACW